jgi:hypothetical protein
MSDMALRWTGSHMKSRRSNTADGKTTEKMLTAHHCGKAGDTFETGSLQPSPGNGKKIGTFADGNTGGFLSYGADIDTVTGHFNASIYIGSWKGGSLSKIKGVFTPVKGDIVCADGSYSGQVCNNKITGTDIWECESGDTKNSSTCYGGMVKAVNKTGALAVGNGDSGRPIYMPTKGGVKVGGIIAAIVNGYPACNGYPAASNRKCSSDFYFSPVVRFTTENSGWKVMTE